MHLILCIITLLITWKWAEWRNWKTYHATMLFLPIMNLVYNVISFSSGHFLWRMKPDFLINHVISELTYTLTLLPCTSLLYLSNTPSNKVNTFLRYIKYICIYSLVEAFMYMAGRIEYNHGWSIWHSVFFYFIMFIAITVHNKKPIIAYVVFICITIFGVWYFKLPIQ